MVNIVFGCPLSESFQIHEKENPLRIKFFYKRTKYTLLQTLLTPKVMLSAESMIFDISFPKASWEHNFNSMRFQSFGNSRTAIAAMRRIFFSHIWFDRKKRLNKICVNNKKHWFFFYCHRIWFWWCYCYEKSWYIPLQIVKSKNLFQPIRLLVPPWFHVSVYLRTSSKIPAFVPQNVTNKNCFGCIKSEK